MTAMYHQPTVALLVDVTITENPRPQLTAVPEQPEPQPEARPDPEPDPRFAGRWTSLAERR